MLKYVYATLLTTLVIFAVDVRAGRLVVSRENNSVEILEVEGRQLIYNGAAVSLGDLVNKQRARHRLEIVEITREKLEIK